MNTIAFVRADSIYSDSRATKEIMALCEAGYSVLVIGWDRDGHAVDKCRDVFRQNVKFLFYNKNVTGRLGYGGIFKLAGFIKYVYQQLNANRKTISSVHACDLDAGLGAYAFCKKHNVPLIYDIYDYYIDSHDLKGLLGVCIEKLEISIINFAHTTIICTEERREQIKKASPRNVVVIYNSPDVASLPYSEIQYDYVYCGVFGQGRLLQEIFEDYKQHADLKFLIAGRGLLDGIVKNNAKEFVNFKYVGAVPYSEVLQFEAQSAIMSAIYNPNKRNHILCAPNKFYEALALGKPIIVCKGTGIDKIVKEQNVGVVIDYSAEQFYAALSYLKENTVLTRSMGKKARMLYETVYNWEKMKKRLLYLYSRLGKC